MKWGGHFVYCRPWIRDVGSGLGPSETTSQITIVHVGAILKTHNAMCDGLARAVRSGPASATEMRFTTSLTLQDTIVDAQLHQLEQHSTA